MNTHKHLALAALAVGSSLLSSLPATGQNAGQFPGFLPLPGTPPEGVAVDKVGNVYVSLAGSGSDQIWKFSPAGDASLLADFGPPAGGMCGLAVEAEGTVYMARNRVPLPGVFRVDKNGSITLLPGTGTMACPNALAFDKRGALYVTETYSLNPDASFGQGGIWRVPKSGSAELWLRHDLLTGLPPYLFPFPVGANGVAFRGNALYVANSDKALVLRIPVLPDGSPGQPEVWKQVEDVPESIFHQNPLFPLMIDGLALDVLGNVYIAVPSRNAVVRINAADGSQETLAVFPGPLNRSPVLLDSPLSLAFGTGKGERRSLFITNGGMIGRFVPGVWPGLSLAKIDAGVPGQPLP
jgi:sugar lactone lactonase YvrE